MRLDRYCHIELVAAAVHFLQQFPEPFGHPSAGLLPGGERNLEFDLLGRSRGPDGPPVTIDFTTSATTSVVNLDSKSIASATITDSSGNSIKHLAITSYLNVSGNSPCPTICPPSFNVTTSFQNAPNELFEVEIGASVGNFFGGSTGASAYVDPHFFLPPDEASLYTLDFSPGIGNTPMTSIPEPSTRMMIMLGFLGIGIASAGRNQRAQARA